jgi:hypothetical protein
VTNFSTGSDSPVIAAWLTNRSLADSRRRSADHVAAESSTMSPGTSWRMGTSTRRAPAVQHVEVALRFGGDLSTWSWRITVAVLLTMALSLSAAVLERFLHEAQQRRDHHHGADHDGGLHVLGVEGDPASRVSSRLNGFL